MTTDLLEGGRSTPSDKNRLLKQAIHSDVLPLLRAFLGEYEIQLSAFFKIFQINIILDANVILAEIRWLAIKRKNPDARSALMEVLECETVKAYAPHFLSDEIEKNVLKIAEEDSVSTEELLSYWNQYKPYIEFIDIEDPTEEELRAAQDPKDLPYIKLQNKVGAMIYSNDPHITAMGGRAIDATIVARLRSYSRSAAVEYSLKFAGASSILITQATVVAAFELTKMLIAQAKKIPPWGIAAGALLVVVAIAHPKTRAYAVSWIESLPQNLGDASKKILEFSAPLIEIHNEAKTDALCALEDINGIIESVS